MDVNLGTHQETTNVVGLKATEKLAQRPSLGVYRLWFNPLATPFTVQ